MAAVTLSGFNGIDFNTIISAIMQSESQPLQALQDRQSKIQSKDSAFVSLGAIVSAPEAPVTSLASPLAFTNLTTASNDTSIAIVSLGSDALAVDRERGGDLTAQLDTSYTYINSKILEGSTQLQIAPLEEAIKLLTILLAGWEEAAKKEDLAVPTTLLARQAANTGRFRLHA